MNAKIPLQTSHSSLPATPYYLLDEAAIVANMKIIARLCELSGAKALLALKCFATWGVFDVMRPFLHGTTSSSLNEVRLGHETFGKGKDSDNKKETHAYSVAYSADEIDEEELRLVDDPEQCQKLAFDIEANIQLIHRFWQGRRRG